jgi:hypothetical protein
LSNPNADAMGSAPLPQSAAQAAAPWWSRRRTWWELFLQFFAVTLGVVAGAAATSWREERASKASEVQALQGIANELAFNRQQMQQRVDYYAQVITDIDAAVTARGEVAGIGDVPSFRGLNPVLLRKSSFDVSQYAQAFRRLDYQLAERIAVTYALQDWVLNAYEKWMDFMIQRSEDEPRLRAWRAAFNDWVIMGRELLTAYDQILPDLPAGRSVGLH